MNIDKFIKYIPKASEIVAVRDLITAIGVCSIFGFLSIFIDFIKNNIGYIILVFSIFCLYIILSRIVLFYLKRYFKKLKIQLTIDEVKKINILKLNKWSPTNSRTDNLKNFNLDEKTYIINISFKAVHDIKIENFNVVLDSENLVYQEYNKLVKKEISQIFNAGFDTNMLKDLKTVTDKRHYGIFSPSQMLDDFIRHNEQYKEIYSMINNEHEHSLKNFIHPNLEHEINRNYIEYVKKKYKEDRVLELSENHKTKTSLVDAQVVDGVDFKISCEIKLLKELVNHDGSFVLKIYTDGRERICNISFKDLLKNKVLYF